MKINCKYLKGLFKCSHPLREEKILGFIPYRKNCTKIDNYLFCKFEEVSLEKISTKL